VITRALILLNVLAFGWEELDMDRALNLGALTPNSVLLGQQWYRIVTAAFLHGGLVHIGVNMLSLWSLGRFIYVVAMLASGLGVVYLSSPQYLNVPTLGASGAIFGLFGALFAIGLKLGRPGMQLVRDNIGILALNLIITFAPGLNISWQAHVCGLIAGFLLTLAIYTPPRRVAPVVTDSATGQAYETEYQTPGPPQ
jgi:membrane associated rhomboid family serine protease